MKCLVEDTKDDCNNWVRSYRLGGYQHHTRSAIRWKNMRRRTCSGGKYQLKNPTYVGSTMSENFEDFQYFATWHSLQIGYMINDYALEKDILVYGNKVYSEDTCVLVPKPLNSFLVSANARRGSSPQGVSYDKRCGLYQVDISIGNESTYLGKYLSQEVAAGVYKEAKEAEAYRWYERLRDGEFVVDERVIERMRTWKHIRDWVAP